MTNFHDSIHVLQLDGTRRAGDSIGAPWRRNGVVLRRRLWDLEETKCLLPIRNSGGITRRGAALE